MEKHVYLWCKHTLTHLSVLYFVLERLLQEVEGVFLSVCFDHHLPRLLQLFLQTHTHTHTRVDDLRADGVCSAVVCGVCTSIFLKCSCMTLLLLSNSTIFSRRWFISPCICVFVRSRSSLFTSRPRISKRIWFLSFSISTLSASRNWFLCST